MVDFVEGFLVVDKNVIIVFGVCVGVMYILMVVLEDVRISKVVIVVFWFYDVEVVKLFYGGEEGV